MTKLVQNAPHFKTTGPSKINRKSVEVNVFQKLAKVKYYIQAWEFEALIYFKIDEKNFFHYATLELDSDTDDHLFSEQITAENTISTDVSYNERLTYKENILKVLEYILRTRSAFESFPFQFSSDIISKVDYKNILQNITQKQHQLPESELLELAQQNGLQPYESHFAKGIFLSRCVQSENHNLYISITEDGESWGCGHCKRKGGIKELQNWINEKKG